MTAQGFQADLRHCATHVQKADINSKKQDVLWLLSVSWSADSLFESDVIRFERAVMLCTVGVVTPVDVSCCATHCRPARGAAAAASGRLAGEAKPGVAAQALLLSAVRRWLHPALVQSRGNLPPYKHSLPILTCSCITISISAEHCMYLHSIASNAVSKCERVCPGCHKSRTPCHRSWHKFIRLYYVDEIVCNDSALTINITMTVDRDLLLVFSDRKLCAKFLWKLCKVDL